MFSKVRKVSINGNFSYFSFVFFENQLGSELFSEILDSAPISPYHVDLEGFRDGVYLVLVFSEARKLEVGKLVVSRF